MCKCGHMLWDHDYNNHEKCTVCDCESYYERYEDEAKGEWE